MDKLYKIHHIDRISKKEGSQDGLVLGMDEAIKQCIFLKLTDKSKLFYAKQATYEEKKIERYRTT